MINDDIIRLRALEPEDLECLYKWENDMDLWEVSDTLTPFSLFTLKKYIETCHLDIYTTKQLRLMIERVDTNERIGLVDLYDFDRTISVPVRNIDPQYGKSKTGLRDSRHSPDDRLLFRNIGTKPDLQ